MNTGWKCPNCGKAHGPDVVTCPEPPRDPYSLPTQIGYWPIYPYQSPFDKYKYRLPEGVYCGDPPGSITTHLYHTEYKSGEPLARGVTQIICAVTGQSLGPAD